MKSANYLILIALCLLSISGCNPRLAKRPIVTGISSTAQSIEPLVIGYVPPFPDLSDPTWATHTSKDAEAAAAYNACILELISAKEQDAKRRENHGR